MLFPIVAMQTCLFVKPLLSNGCCIFAYLTVVAQQQVYMHNIIELDMFISYFRSKYSYSYMLRACVYGPKQPEYDTAMNRKELGRM
jgi:hypothetical protein